MTFATRVLRALDPRRSLLAATIWLVAILAAGFAAAASYWAGGVAEQIVVQQHVRRLALETDQLASDLGQAAATRIDAVRAIAGQGSGADFYARLLEAYPDLGWLWFEPVDGPRSHAAWFNAARTTPWLGVIAQAERSSQVPLLGEIAIAVRGDGGHLKGVVTARLTWHWADVDVERLSTTLNPRGSAQTLTLDRDGTVLVGPGTLLGTRWNGVPLHLPPPIAPSDEARGGVPRFERLPDGRVVLVARAAVRLAGEQQSFGWQVQLSEPMDAVYARANALRNRILWISVCLAGLVGLGGAIAARQLIERLQRLTRSAVAVGRGEQSGIEVPAGEDEVAQLGRAFAKVLDDLQRERGDLRALSEDLERRVIARTREVERLAEESRYAAIVRERLKIARDLHDTLAHSMMAILSEIRLLRRMHAARPQGLAEELARAETVAHEGLHEARKAIAHMRFNAVRDTGLGAALKTAFDRFLDRTGLEGTFVADAEASSFGDERAETLFRIAEEALRNVEKHAAARRVSVDLHVAAGKQLEMRIADDGAGFEPQQDHPGHFGLVGLREQAQLIGAQLQIDSAPNQGSRVTVRLRVAPEGLGD